MKDILVTSALPYVNNLPHFGNIIGSHLPADIFARFNRTFGNNTTFVGGADAHGTPVLITAKELGLPGDNKTLEKLTEDLNGLHRKIYEKLNISYDLYSSTHTKTHEKISQEFYSELKKNGYITESKLTMHYCKHDDMFLPDRYVAGTCPNCGYEGANGDECEKCTRSFTPSELKNPKCAICGNNPELKETGHLFIKLSALSDKLDAFLESRKDIWRKATYNESKGWITEGLKDRCITRDIKWGIPVNEEGYENKVFYVWYEAPIGYISITKELSEELYKKFWLEKNDSEIYYFVGKDNIPFHAVFFPSMLAGHGKYKQATNLGGFQYLNFEGQKFSKSKKIGAFCSLKMLSEDSKVDIDVLRAYLATVIPESKDTDFSWDGFKQNTNTELANKLGNFFNRTISMTNQYLGGKINIKELALNDDDKEFINVIKTLPNEIAECYQNIELREAYKKTIQMAMAGNAYLEKNAPWNLFKEGRLEEIEKVLYLALNMCKALAICFSPVTPVKMQEFWNAQLKLEGLSNAKGNWQNASELDFPKIHTIGAPAPLFPRLDDARLNEIKAEMSEPLNLKELFKN